MTKHPDAWELTKCIENLIGAHILLADSSKSAARSVEARRDRDVVSQMREVLYEELHLLCVAANGRK